MSVTPPTDSDDYSPAPLMQMSPPNFKKYFKTTTSEKESPKTELQSELSPFVTRIIHSYLSTYDLINKVSVLNKSTRLQLLNNKSIPK